MLKRVGIDASPERLQATGGRPRPSLTAGRRPYATNAETNFCGKSSAALRRTGTILLQINCYKHSQLYFSTCWTITAYIELTIVQFFVREGARTAFIARAVWRLAPYTAPSCANDARVTI